MKIKILVICIVCLIMFTTGFFVFRLYNSDALKFKREYEKYNDKYVSININKDNNIKYIGMDEALNILSSGTGIIYIGNAKNNKCRAVIPTVLEMALDEEIDNIYYLDDSYINDLNKNSKFMKRIDGFLPDDSNKLSSPSFIFIMGGKIVSFYSNSNYDKALTSKEKKELSSLLKDNIDKMYGTCDESC